MSSFRKTTAYSLALRASTFGLLAIVSAAQTNADVVKPDSVRLSLTVSRPESSRLAISLLANNLTNERIELNLASEAFYSRFDKSAEFAKINPGGCPIRGSGPGDYSISTERKTFDGVKPEINDSLSETNPMVSPFPLSDHTSAVIQQFVFPSYDCFHHERRVREMYASVEWSYSDRAPNGASSQTVTSPEISISSE